MKEQQDPDAQENGTTLGIEGLNPGFLREEHSRSIRDAVDWGLERCGSDAARALFPPLVTLLSAFNATVLPVEHGPEGPAIDFRITLSRTGTGGRAVRFRVSVLSGAPGESSGSDEGMEPGTMKRYVEVEDCLEGPWPTAADIVGELLNFATGATE